MRKAVLRPLARDRPDRLLQIEVFPSHRAQLPATLRREDWDVPASIEKLAGAVSVSRRADQAAARAALTAKAGR